MARGRPTRIESILSENIQPGRFLTIREIAIMADVAAAYKDYSAAYSAIRQLLVSKLGLTPAGRRGDEATGPMFFASDDILLALGVAPVRHEPLSDVVPSSPGKPRWLWPAMALTATFVTMTLSLGWLEGREASVSERIQVLAAADDIEGLREFEREVRQHWDLRDFEDTESESQEIAAAFGLSRQVSFDPILLTDTDHPSGTEGPLLRETIAGMIAEREQSVQHVSENQILAVFPEMETWLYLPASGLVEVRLGTRIKIDGHSGYVTKVQNDRLTLRTDLGKDTEIERTPLRIMDARDTPGAKTLIYPSLAGNLDGLLTWMADKIGVRFDNRSMAPGQIAGYFPPYDSPEAFARDLESMGVLLTRDSLTLLPEPRVKLKLGFHETKVYSGNEIENHLRSMAELLPQEIYWPELPPGTWWYTGQQLDTLLEQFDLVPVYRRDGSIDLLD